MFPLTHKTILANLLLLTTTKAAYPPSRNCTPQEYDPHPSFASYTILNASGSTTSPGFKAPNSLNPSTTWTWSIGVQNVWNFTNDIAFWYEQPVWLDTAGQDLASADLGFEMCYMSMDGFSADEQRRGQSDTGDCTKFWSQECVTDWKKALSSEALKFVGRNSSGSNPDTPCKNLMQFTPDSCKDFMGGFRYSGPIPPANRTCPFGLGSPDYDTVTRYTYRGNSSEPKNSAEDLRLYDEAVTGTKPILAVAWSSEPSIGWSDSRIVCLSPKNVTEGSRKPSGVPSSSSRVGVEGFFLVVCGVLALALL